MINKFQTLPSEQVSLSKAEMVHMTDHSQEGIIMRNTNLGSSTTHASIAQGMYSFFNPFVEYFHSSPLNIFFISHLFVCSLVIKLMSLAAPIKINS